MTPTKAIEQLHGHLKEAGFKITSQGSNWRVTAPDGGPAVHVPKRLGRGGNGLKPVLARLLSIGYDPTATKPAATKPAMTTDEAIAMVAQAPKKKGEPPAPHTEFVVIDAERAQELLQRNKYYQPEHEGKTNRKYRPGLAERYARAMLRGEWMWTNDGAAFDWNGDMLDGQHVLGAIVLANMEQPGIQVPVALTWNLDPASMSKFDIGTKRQVSDFLQMEGESDTLALAATARLVVCYDHRNEPGVWTKGWITPDQVLDLVTKEPEIRMAVRRARVLRAPGDTSALMLVGAAGAGVHICTREYPDGPMDEFLHALTVGDDLSKGDPRLAFRNWLFLVRSSTKRRKDPVEQLALFIKTWNHWLNGERRVGVRWSARSENFPVAVRKV